MMNEYLGYLLSPDAKYPQNIRIAKAGKGGSTPNSLIDLYTSREFAKAAIDLYLNTVKVVKEKKSNAKAVQNS